MLSISKIVNRPDQPFAVIRGTFDRTDVPNHAPPLIGEVLKAPGGKTRMLFRQMPFISREERVVGTDGSPQGRPRSERLPAGTLGAR